MSRLYVREIRFGLETPPFGAEFNKHITEKKNPAARAASVSAWNLLYEVIGEHKGEIRFDGNGKPYFLNGPHFSISHSASLAAVLISDQPCGVDIERIDDRIALRLAKRCLSPNEAGRNFFECWTRKECLVKLDGHSLFAHPERIDTTLRDGLFFTTRVCDAAGQAYVLSAICTDAAGLSVQHK